MKRKARWSANHLKPKDDFELSSPLTFAPFRILRIFSLLVVLVKAVMSRRTQSDMICFLFLVPAASKASAGELTLGMVRGCLLKWSPPDQTPVRVPTQQHKLWWRCVAAFGGAPKIIIKPSFPLNDYWLAAQLGLTLRGVFKCDSQLATHYICHSCSPDKNVRKLQQNGYCAKMA